MLGRARDPEVEGGSRSEARRTLSRPRGKESRCELDCSVFKIEALEAIQKRLDVPAARVWRATLAGAGTDLVYVVSEYASLAAYAESSGKPAADPEAAKLLRELEASGIRTIVDRSLFVDETP